MRTIGERGSLGNVWRDVALAVEYVREQVGDFSPRVGLILGSGLGAVADKVKNAVRVEYSQIPCFPVSTVAGHDGCLVAGKLGGVDVVVMQGRFHYYEGYSMDRVTLPVRVLYALGVKILVVTNASGGVNREYRPGDIMQIEDHINGLPNPLRGPNFDAVGPRFPSMHCAYDRDLLALVHKTAEELDICLKQGCYASTEGPSFETPHEYEYFRLIGADAVGMSTTPEVIVAVHAGMRVVGFSVIANVGGLNREEEVTHDEVQRLSGEASEALGKLLLAVVPRLV